MTIKVGDQIPSMKLMMGTPDGPKETSTDEVFKGKKVVLFAVPGAFTPTCSVKHLPSFVQNADALKGKGVDTIACIAVNDAFVMAAWGKEQGVDGKITMLADGSAAFTKALGLELDLMARGMGTRSQRYALIAQDGKVTHLAVEAPGGFEVSKAEIDPGPSLIAQRRDEGGRHRSIIRSPPASPLRHIALQLGQPGVGVAVRRRAPVAARRQRAAGAHLRSVRHGRALELAEREEAAQEHLQPFADRRKVVGCHADRAESPAASRPSPRRPRHAARGTRSSTAPCRGAACRTD